MMPFASGDHLVLFFMAMHRFSFCFFIRLALCMEVMGLEVCYLLSFEWKLVLFVDLFGCDTCFCCFYFGLSQRCPLMRSSKLRKIVNALHVFGIIQIVRKKQQGDVLDVSDNKV